MRTPSAMPLICVLDVEASTRFYEDVLDFSPVGNFEGSHPGLDGATQLPGANLHARKLTNGQGVSIELVHFRNPQTIGGGSSRALTRIGHSHFVFYTNDLDASVEASSNAGARPLTNTRTPLPGGMEGIFVIDPDGVRVELVAGAGAKGYAHPAISVTDLERSASYYAALGYEVTKRTDFPASDWGDQLNQVPGIALTSQMLENDAGDRLQLIAVSHPRVDRAEGVRPFNRRGWVNLGFDVANLDEGARTLAALGGRMIDGTRAIIGPREQWHGVDPDGIRVKLVADAG